MNKKIISSLFFLFLTFGLYNIALAVPAAPDVFDVMQPDKHAFKARLKGDEWNNWVETDEGYSVNQGDDGFWYYISRFDNDKPVLSPIRAHERPHADLKKRIRPDKKFMRIPPGLSRKAPDESLPSDSGVIDSLFSSAPESSPGAPFSGAILFILASFSNRAGTYSEASFAAFLSNNINDYFNKASYGLVTLSPANESFGTANNGVVGWVNLGYNHPNTGSTTNTSNQTLTKNAIIAADPYVNFSTYDNDGDGYVDADELAVVVIAAGYEKAYGTPPSPSVWGHRWSLDDVAPPTVDGVIVGAYHGSRGGYAQFGEIHSNHQATMGIMVHELGHLIFGFPDLYDTNGGSSGIGGFGVMGSGSWGKANSDSYSGQTPVLPCAWVKYQIGWVDGSENSDLTSIAAAGSNSANSANSAFKLLTGSSNEYFLVENRQPLGYDRGLESWLGAGFGGLAIWHIDKNKTDNTAQCAPPTDCTSSHFMVSLEQADGNWDLEKNLNDGNKTDLWYSGNVTAFNSISTPNSNLYNGTLSDVSITDISTSGADMMATLAAPVVTLYENNFESDSLGAEWSTNSTGQGRILVTRNFYPNRGKFHVTMDSASGYALNELIFTIDLTGRIGVVLNFFQMEIGDEDHAMPASFAGSHNSDGVAISADGNNWFRVVDLGIARPNFDYAMFEVDLDAAITAAGISYNGAFKIKFQQYDNFPLSSDGITFDDIEISALPPSCTDTDGDGYGNPGDASCSNGSQTDCNDSNNLEFPGQTWYEDIDGDGYSSGNIIAQCGRPANYYVSSELTATSGDYNDNDPNIYPGGPPVRDTGTGTSYYTTLQAAYNASAGGDTIQSQSVNFTENLNINLNKSITLQGGYNNSYTAVTGKTTLNGNMTISDGTVTLENFILQ